MIIAVNTRHLINNYLEGYGYFTFEIFSRIVKNHPEHQFIFIFDRPYDKSFISSDNVKAVVTGPPARHPLLWIYWYNIKLPAVLRKHKADVFISCDGFCSLTTKVPQVLVIHDLSFIHYPSFISRSRMAFYKKNTPRFLSKAKRIITVSDFSRRDILLHYKVDEEKIDIVPNSARKIFHPLNDTEKHSLKNELTSGKEYFAYVGSIHPRKNLVNLLKAFSVFKKKQLSNWKLVLAGRLAWKNEEFIKSLNTYKYRDDVVMTGYVEETKLSRIMGSAYALIYPSLWEGFGMPVLEAMRCDVPVITTADSAMQEVAKDAALYSRVEDHTDLAEQMLLLYKDEALRNRLIQKGKIISDQYDWDRSAELFWKNITKAVENPLS